MLEIKPAQPRQSNIKHKATGPIRGPFLQEVLCGPERLGSQPNGSQHALDRVAHRCIVIDYKNCGLIFSHRRSPGSSADQIGTLSLAEELREETHHPQRRTQWRPSTS